MAHEVEIIVIQNVKKYLFVVNTLLGVVTKIANIDTWQIEIAFQKKQQV